MEFSVKFLKEGQNRGPDHILSTKSSLVCHVLKPKSWVIFLGPPLFISQTLREF